uniref:Uncharacterized protein n=1 Tax=Timema cristinae TaxID=61476 RepID=A0A7R9CCU4_TIMCR|nr:unnamed protein product [Timema cristinae]
MFSNLSYEYHHFLRKITSYSACLLIRYISIYNSFFIHKPYYLTNFTQFKKTLDDKLNMSNFNATTKQITSSIKRRGVSALLRATSEWVCLDAHARDKLLVTNLVCDALLSQALYYASNFNKILDIVNNLREDNASSIRNVKELLLKDIVRNDLAFIAANYSALPYVLNTSTVNSI